MSDLWYLMQHVEEQRARDNQPCSICGGDRLRPDYTPTPRCHAPRKEDT